jgi:hypothetical protein
VLNLNVLRDIICTARGSAFVSIRFRQMNANSQTYMDVDWKMVIKEEFNLLERSIDPTEELFNRLRLIPAISSHLAAIEAKPTPNEKTGGLLSVLAKIELSVLANTMKEFVSILEYLKQDHVANVLQGKKDGNQPMSQTNLDCLNRHAVELKQFIDPLGGMLDNLLVEDVFSTSDQDRVKFKKTLNEQAEEVVNIIRRKSDCAFDHFIAVLHKTNQSHVVYILTNGVEGVAPLCQYNIDVMTKNRFIIVGNMEPVSSGLLEALVSNGSFSLFDRDRAASCRDVVDKNVAILDIMMRKSQAAFDGFIRALDSTGQKHVRNCIEAIVKIDVEVMPGRQSTDEETTPEQDNATSTSRAVDADNNYEDKLSKQLKENMQKITSTNGIASYSVVRNCIKLRFSIQSLESLNKLQQMLESKRLQNELTEMCQPVLTAYGFDTITFHTDPRDFDQAKKDLKYLELMTKSHTEALKSAETVRKLSDLVEVSEDLLRQLSLSDKLKCTVRSGKSRAENVRVLLDITSRRQDSAFDELIDALKATGQHTAGDSLFIAGDNKERQPKDCRPCDGSKEQKTDHKGLETPLPGVVEAGSGGSSVVRSTAQNLRTSASKCLIFYSSKSRK